MLEENTEAMVTQSWKISPSRLQSRNQFIIFGVDRKLCKYFLVKLLSSSYSKREKYSPISKEFKTILGLAYQFRGEGFSDMKEDDLNELIKSYDLQENN